MQNKITALTRDIHIHQDVEKELAKRSHYSQKIIKRMKDRIKDLESMVAENATKSKLNMDMMDPILDNETVSNKHGTSAGRYDRKKIG